ncbi:MAG: hypothetical protein EPN86_04280 [Nanoarchaeota archaeon]|nr:MAG: hypothetical protein EPN86_04280 [Nanoarchaeota archaeon]
MKRVILALVILSIIAAGCGNQKQGTSATFIGGDKGVTLSFVEGSPPDEAFDAGQRPFDVVVQLNNVGEYDVSQNHVLVKVSGLSPNDFGVLSQDLVKRASEPLTKTQKDPNGDTILAGSISTVEFTNLRYLPVLSGPTTFPVRVDVCYKYGTISESTLCIKENPLDERQQSVCKVNEAKTVENSGAPVKVTGLREFAKGRDQVGFTFTIEKTGTGDLFRPESDCNANTDSIVDENKVFVSVDTRLSDLKCTGLQGGSDTSGYAVLYSGSGGLSRAITCTQGLPPRVTAFPQLVRITLEYDYKDFISKPIVIKHG